jgi:flagellar protein FlaH
MTEVYSLGLSERDRVDRTFGGGIPAGTLGLVEGPQGAGKSTLVRRFVYGLLETGTPTTYVSPELSAGEFVAQMSSLSYDVTDHLLAGRLLYLSAAAATYGEGRALVAPFLRSETLWRADVVVVDGLGTLLRNDPKLSRQVRGDDADRVVRKLVDALRERMGRTTTLLVTVDPATVSDRALRPVRSAAGLYLSLETNQVGGEVRRSAVVKRFEEMPAPVNDTVSFSVEQGRGVTIVTRTVA